MVYIRVERKKLVCAAALLVVVVTGISSVATKMIVREGISSRIRLEAIDKNFDNDRCEKVALDTAPTSAPAEQAN